MVAGSAAVLQRLSALSIKDLVRIVATRSFEFAPRILKFVVVVLFLLQVRSWPLVWHFYVWRPVFSLRARYYLQSLSHIFSSPSVRKQKNLEWLNGLSQVGKSPFNFEVSYKTWAGPDDCDFNLHLSNSSYPKKLDAARFKYALTVAPTFLRAGGWTGLGATHFTFVREIPIFSKYEIRVSIMSWDNKWMYVVARYVTHPQKGKGKKAQVTAPPSTSKVPPADAPPNLSLHTANGLHTGVSSPNPNGTAPNPAEVAAQLLERAEPDGAVINCVAISQIVAKIGRITVPPAIIYAVDGFSCAPLEASAEAYSPTNFPPHWQKVRELRGDGLPNASLKKLKQFYTGGWREVPEGQRWWEEALGREVEERRLRGLGCSHALRSGLEEARTI